MIRTHALTKVFRSRGREVSALRRVDLTVAEGEIFGVLGRSGAGKSTLVRCVNLLERPTSGTVEVGGRELTALSARDLRAERRRIGMIFQHFNLLSSRDVAGNVAVPLEIAGVGRAERRRKVGELLELVGLDRHANAYPAQLSGGQKQRVGIARALANDPRVLLCDEATSALDPETTRTILDLLRELRASLGLTILLITHEMDVVKSICDSAALMEDGRVTESGTVADLLTRPDSRLARDMFPLGRHTPDAGAATVVDVTFRGAETAGPFLSTLARTHGVDARILSASVETVGGRQVGRMRIALDGTAEHNKAPLGFLRAQGLGVDVRETGGPATAPGVPAVSPAGPGAAGTPTEPLAEEV
ncbi:ATP-binding cassette domain-containing protein [Yinghuangia sp. ASG 101]|uniref:methionine ABC transporter ATP-binding protein n=1 Tax=Yinghuangia sp. ASG 101 TaxID=2896848 RepID=UPI001E4756AE|nr:ATP-binding cassette domain-containing protein [Yinghuangia sp. ASG 101]UGQ10727.1 ATP-binding cassette domain-containing protein [Yinghuangia sp. ASG 101]